MPKYITIPAADLDDEGNILTLANAIFHPSERLSGLTLSAPHRAFRLSDVSPVFLPEAPGGLATPDAIVSNRSFWLQDLRSYPAAAIQRRGRFVTAQGDVTNLRTVDAGWLVGAGDAVRPLPEGCSFGRYLEYPAGIRHPVSFDGAARARLDGGAVLVSDIVRDGTTGQPLVIPAGAPYWEVNTNPTGASQTMPAWLNENGQGHALMVAGRPLDTLGIGLAGAAGRADVKIFSSIFLMGDILASGAGSALLCGDSLATGWGDQTAASPGGEKGMARIPEAFGWGCFNASSRGGTPAGYAQALAPLLARVLAACGARPSHAIVQSGVNSLGARSAAQILSDRDRMRQALGAMVPGLAFIDTTLTPASRSGDGWASGASQQVTGGAARIRKLAEVNGAIRARATAGTGTVWDVADIVMTARDSGLWRPGFPAGDGLHITSEGQARIAQILAAGPRP